jgi:hypothetical protein
MSFPPVHRLKDVHTNSCFKKHSTYIDIHTHMNTYLYEHMHVHPTSISTFEKLD